EPDAGRPAPERIASAPEHRRSRKSGQPRRHCRPHSAARADTETKALIALWITGMNVVRLWIRSVADRWIEIVARTLAAPAQGWCCRAGSSRAAEKPRTLFRYRG